MKHNVPTFSPVSPLSPTALLDQQVHAAVADLFGARSPTLSANAWRDWWAHIAISPGKQSELWQQAMQNMQQLTAYAAITAWKPREQAQAEKPAAAGDLPLNDRRFKDPAWQSWPYNLWAQSYLLGEQWWRAATNGVRGVDPHHTEWVGFNTQLALDALHPGNFAPLNPVVLQRTLAEGGANLLRGMQFFAEDTLRTLKQQPPATSEAFKVGRDVAVTPGKVVLRTPLMELIQYTPTTEKVHPEPILIVPAWIMKYYILDLSPHNSLIRYLVSQGHTVFCISWKNPGHEEQFMNMDDYLELGLMAAIDAVSSIVPKRAIHAAGYCLGGTLLSIGAAAMAHDGDERLGSLTMLAAQTDFSEPGPLSVYIDANQLNLLGAQMAETGYLTGEQMAVAFQWLNAYDLLWSQIVNNYLLGERSRSNDLMAWNADTTRMPARMHRQYLRHLFLRNDLSGGRYKVKDHPVALSYIRKPIYCVGTVTDHVAPWRSVYKLHLFTSSEITFVLTSGGHNAGIVSEPGHARRSYQQLVRPAQGPCLNPDEWLQTAPRTEGSWWESWSAWLAQHSSAPAAAPPMGRKPYTPLCDAPGTYVLQR